MQKIFPAKQNIGKPSTGQPRLVMSDRAANILRAVVKNDCNKISTFEEILVPGLIDMQVQAFGHVTPIG